MHMTQHCPYIYCFSPIFLLHYFCFVSDRAYINWFIARFLVVVTSNAVFSCLFNMFSHFIRFKFYLFFIAIFSKMEMSFISGLTVLHDFINTFFLFLGILRLLVCSLHIYLRYLIAGDVFTTNLSRQLFNKGNKLLPLEDWVIQERF